MGISMRTAHLDVLAAAAGHRASPGSARAARGRGSHASASPGGVLASCGGRTPSRLHLRAGTGAGLSL